MQIAPPAVNHIGLPQVNGELTEAVLAAAIVNLLLLGRIAVLCT